VCQRRSADWLAIVSAVKSSLGALILVLFVACSGAAAAPQPSSYPYVKVNLAPEVTAAQLRAIKHRLAANPDVRAVQLLTREKQLASAKRLYKILLPPADVAAAIQTLERNTKNDVLCVKTRSKAAADRLFATFDLTRSRTAVSISKYSGGEMLSACNLVDGLEHTRVSVTVAPPSSDD
jgi:cell division protein FtsX